MTTEAHEMGCGRCKYYYHIKGQPAGGLCKDPASPYYGYIGRYGELVEFCDRMVVDA